MCKLITGKYFLIATILGASLIAAGKQIELTFQNGLNDYSGTLDTMLRGGDKLIEVSNYGGIPQITISGVPWGGGKCLMLIKFDKIIGKNANQIPPDVKIISASLELYKFENIPKNSGQYKANYISLFPMLNDFEFGSEKGKPQENSVCFLFRKYSVDEQVYWGNKNQEENGPVRDVDYDSAQRVAGNLKPDKTGVWLNWNISKIAAAWPADPGANRGMLLFAAAYYEGVGVAGAEYPDAKLRPKLIITFDNNSQPASK